MGKGGGALSAWMKEFVTLVFVQTIQAFIFAIIISIILYGLGGNEETAATISADDNNAALGLMSVFALLSIFKVEDMVKKIFGISDTKASHRSALSSLAKTAVAARLGSRVLNNAGKFFGGLRSARQAGQDRRKLKKRLDEDMKDEGFVKGSDGKWAPAQSSSPKRTVSLGVSQTNTVGVNTNTGLAPISRNSDDAVNIDMDALFGNANSQAQMSAATQRRVKNALRAYEDKASEINKARNEGIKNMISSATESVGAVIGGTAGGILLGADGDIDDMLRGVVGGAGVGDIVGKGAVEAVDKATKLVQRNYKREKGVSNKELKRAIDEYKDAVGKTKRTSEINIDDIDV